MYITSNYLYKQNIYSNFKLLIWFFFRSIHVVKDKFSRRYMIEFAYVNDEGTIYIYTRGQKATMH